MQSAPGVDGGGTQVRGTAGRAVSATIEGGRTQWLSDSAPTPPKPETLVVTDGARATAVALLGWPDEGHECDRAVAGWIEVDRVPTALFFDRGGFTSATRADHRRSWCREGENPTSKFQKGQKRPPGAGRKPGQPNLVTRDIKGGCLYLPEAVYEALREAAFRERRKIHDIVLEGIEMALSKRGWKVSAPRRDQ